MNPPAARWVDLTRTLTPGDRGVACEPRYSFARDGWNAATWHLYSHAGTHLDAQVHSQAGPETVDLIPLERCLGPAWVANCTPIAPRALLTIGHLGPVAEALRPGDSLLLRTDWHRHAGDTALYRDGLPRVSEELARWCVARQVRWLGVEPPSIADVNRLEEVVALHQILLGAGVGIVEGLAHLDELHHSRVWFGALPLKLAAGDGSPVRAFALDAPEHSWPRLSPP